MARFVFREMTTVLIVVAALALFASSASMAQESPQESPEASGDVLEPTSAGVDLSGTWDLNQELSDDPRQKMREAMRSGQGRRGSRGRAGGFGRGGQGRGGFGGGRVGGGGGVGSGGQGRGGERPDGPPEGREHPTQMVIDHQDVTLEISGAGPQNHTIYTDGRSYETRGRRGETLEASAEWQNERLVVTTAGERGERTTIFELVNEGQRLFVTVRMSAFGDGPEIEWRQIYDRTEASETASGAGIEIRSQADG